MTKAIRHLRFADREGWRRWLEANHDSAREAWLVHAKRGHPATTVTYREAVEEALCFGWIDGLLHRLDEGHFVLRYSPRRPGSVWAETNKRRVARLIRQGRMAPAGLEKVRAAKRSGEWAAAARRERIDGPPPELGRALRAAGLLGAFRRLAPSTRKQHLYAVGSAKTAATRTRRVAQIVRLLQAKEKER